MEKRPRKHPASSYDGTDLLQITRENWAIPIPLIRGDIELLIQTFMAQEQHTYQVFTTIWSQLEFDHIHFACLYKDSRETFMNHLYDAVFDYLDVNIDQTKMGVIYALYYLFITQPTPWPIHGIRVDKDRWIHLFDFYIYCCRMESKEYAQAAMIFRRLKDDLHAFVFVADHRLDDLNVMEKKEKEASLKLIEEFHDLQQRRFKDDATATCFDEVTADIGSVVELYEKMKRRACITPQATLATQTWIKDTMNINETNREKLQNVMMKGVLASKDTMFYTTLQQAGRKMWKEHALHGLHDTDVLLPYPMIRRSPAERQQTRRKNRDGLQQDAGSSSVP
ncbi:small nuclear RNA activating complex, subunit SNAP43-domain-containing protein [Halteromyces radiatus]|uniref:small nuclear RNA activating complex, subunit SNAP43-domain-containing protein n=1 Tax=Halteromyces radiatus TaxID=101107 RepID=UPI002220BF9B|nr:small nuclear RNA activating complex, subunit SNAP43-domain-containing protein [Halteromyces radiatus]KAI8076861.1 small nuclear RNA activating complex, subunit SNAP43-domain-containing protein [Halteromyces radiatus]